MKTKKSVSLLVVLSTLSLQAQAPPDLVSSFDMTTDDWRASSNTATLTWEAAAGNPDGHLRATGPGAPWYLVSPAEWAGDWSGYKVLKFDLAIPSGHYPSNDTAGMVVIAATNGATMTWSGPTPLWTWTYYEIDLSPAAFGVDQATFDSIMTNAAELRILAEFVGGTETVGLDNVQVTAAPPTVFTADLGSTFTSGTREGWGVVDDANLAVMDEGRPSWALHGNDTQAGQYFKVVSPAAWAGDWRNFTEVRFDLKWTSSSTNTPQATVLTLFGSSGDVVTWMAVPIRDVWQHYVVPLTPAAFGVDSNRLASILRHVAKIWIHGEFGPGDDVAWFDNITVATGPRTPVVHTTSLVSRFGTDGEGWVGYDNATFAWDPTGGFLGSGAARVVDAGTGTARFQSPDAWAGDWRAFQALRFMVHQAVASDYNAAIWITDFNGNILQQTFTPPLRMWTPYTVDLTPEVFGVDAALFDAVMSDVACVWINSDLDTGGDTTWLDKVSLLPSAATGGPLPNRTATFDSGAEGWTRGNFSSGLWAAPAAVHYYYDATANPSNCVVNSDGGTGTTVFYSPEGWAGDWRGFQSVAFDMNVVQGSQNYMLAPGAMLWLVSAHGSLVQNCTGTPPINAWGSFEFALNPVAFGVTPEEYNRVTRDVVMLAIRSEWLSGTAEREAMDNVVVSTNVTPYWAWLADYLGPALQDPALAAYTADADLDGFDNWGEFVAGTNPTNRQDFLRIERVSVANTNCLLEFNSRAGRLYGVVSTPTLSVSNVWTQLTNDLPGTGSLMSVPSRLTSTQQFYRLKVRLSE